MDHANNKFLDLPIFKLHAVQLTLFVLLVFKFLFRVLVGLENEILRSNAGGTVYSLFNSDWTVQFKYVTCSLYHKIFNLYILL